MAITLPPATLDGFVGEYVLAPAFSITITRERNILYAQATGQQKLPMLAETDTSFFFAAIDAQLSFTRDSSGAITGLVLHQNGQQVPGRRK
jgi:serine-type D-Ala-D-Ala carboxypeptidase/endopeptidase